MHISSQNFFSEAVYLAYKMREREKEKERERERERRREREREGERERKREREKVERGGDRDKHEKKPNATTQRRRGMREYLEDKVLLFRAA
jgi:hypothetical protein